MKLITKLNDSPDCMYMIYLLDDRDRPIAAVDACTLEQRDNICEILRKEYDVEECEHYDDTHIDLGDGMIDKLSV